VNSIETLIQAAMAAPTEQREQALRLLQGNLPKPEPYLTLRELSRKIGFGVTTLRRWNIPRHDLGGTQRYRLGEVEAYLRSEEFTRRQAALRAERRNARPNGKPSPGKSRNRSGSKRRSTRPDKDKPKS
jgi:hypothetical protein